MNHGDIDRTSVWTTRWRDDWRREELTDSFIFLGLSWIRFLLCVSIKAQNRNPGGNPFGKVLDEERKSGEGERLMRLCVSRSQSRSWRQQGRSCVNLNYCFQEDPFKDHTRLIWWLTLRRKAKSSLSSSPSPRSPSSSPLPFLSFLNKPQKTSTFPKLHIPSTLVTDSKGEFQVEPSQVWWEDQKSRLRAKIRGQRSEEAITSTWKARLDRLNPSIMARCLDSTGQNRTDRDRNDGG